MFRGTKYHLNSSDEIGKYTLHYGHSPWIKNISIKFIFLGGWTQINMKIMLSSIRNYSKLPFDKENLKLSTAEGLTT